MAQNTTKTVSEYGRVLLQASVDGDLATFAYLNRYGMFIGSNYVQTNVAATTAELDDAGDLINTTNKYAFKMFGNMTTGKPVFATGTCAAAVWNDATGSTAHTPV